MWSIKKLFLVLIPVVILISCTGELESFRTENYEYTNSFSKGPISLEMKVDAVDINTSENIKIYLEGTAADGWKPSFSTIEGDLDKFTVVGVADTPPRLGDNGSIEISRTIILKPFLSGEYSIPPLALDYSDKDDNKGTLLSTSVPISVTSLLPENTENLQVKAIQEPNTVNYVKLVLYISIAIFILGGILLIVYFLRKRKRERLIPEIPPFEEAFAKLNILLNKNLPELGMFKEFYIQLNLIVRIYIEKQFALRAPEQTTEEFLQDLSVSDKITGEFKKSLKNFLIHSDLVKFARHKPVEDEIKDSIESCKNFIKVTGEIL